MNDLVKIIGIGLTGGMCALMLRHKKPEFSVIVSLTASVIICGQLIMGISGVIDEIYTIIEECGVDIKYFAICIKATGMAYIAQFASEILHDSGEVAIASKVEAAGKISILLLTMPVMTSFLRLCVKVVSGI